ncbi:MFS transporter [Natronococcus occultus]|uniref:Sugar phosphate permease n=1 Tax=Natronococcus occultus SP4 TaxID=694430 RepID=L0JY80_9EURY|nr:MFS transporter [Natronococcus occultus]AGB37074.1 sugar phosphate permease [Natronococcus occultus SP4]
MEKRLSAVVDTARVYNVVVIVSLLWFMVQFLRFVFPPLFETFQETYGVSNTETGMLFTALMIGYACMQFPAGVLGDRIGEPRVIIGGAVVFSGAAALVATGQSFLLILAGAVLIGLGTGPHKTVAIPLLSKRYKERTGLALGFMDTVGQFGGMLAPLAVVALMSFFVWQNVFVLGAVVSLVLGWLFYVTVRRDSELRTSGVITDEESSTDSNESIFKTFRTVFRNRRLLIFVAVAMAFTFSWNALSAFFPLFLTSEKGVSSGVASILYSILFIASISQTATGDISDRRDSISVAFALFALMFVAILSLIIVDSLLTLVAITVLAGIGFHGFRPVRDSYLMDVIPENVGGSAFGMIRTGMTGVGALSPAIVGYISDDAGFVAAFLSIAGIILIGAVLLVFLR